MRVDRAAPERFEIHRDRAPDLRDRLLHLAGLEAARMQQSS
jgi:hypothetical protein